MSNLILNQRVSFKLIETLHEDSRTRSSQVTRSSLCRLDSHLKCSRLPVGNHYMPNPTVDPNIKVKLNMYSIQNDLFQLICARKVDILNVLTTDMRPNIIETSTIKSYEPCLKSRGYAELHYSCRILSGQGMQVTCMSLQQRTTKKESYIITLVSDFIQSLG